MAWTAPRTWVTGEQVTAALLNTHLKDNMLETASAVVANAGEYVVADAANSLVVRKAVTDVVATSEATTSTSYANLPTAGPSVSTVATLTEALVIVTARIETDTGGSNGFMSFAISGATTVAANDAQSLSYESSNAGDRCQAAFAYLVTGLTAGNNTFTTKYRTESAAESTFIRRRITVIPY